MAMKKTALIIDTDLVDQVRQLLGTKTTTETINEALREIIRMHGRAAGLERLRRRQGLDLDPETMRGAWRHKRDDTGGDDGAVPRRQERIGEVAPR